MPKTWARPRRLEVIAPDGSFVYWIERAPFVDVPRCFRRPLFDHLRFDDLRQDSQGFRQFFLDCNCFHVGTSRCFRCGYYRSGDRAQ